MKFTPLTEEEIQQCMLLPDGIYSYRVIKSEDKISNTGNEYISLTLLVTDNQGNNHTIFTNLALIKLLKHFCDVNDMKDEYKSGNIPSSLLLNKSGGKVLIGMEGEKPNPNGGVYKAKNIVKDYVLSPHGSTLLPLSKKEDFINDDLPF